MILVPEIETVVILVPRTASGALYRAVLATYPKAMMPYRHMEADGVPAGYDRWRKVGVVRNPIDRLWSLYKFQKNPPNKMIQRESPDYVRALRESAERPFSEWLTNNDIVFTSPYDRGGSLRFWPQYTVRHPLPENRKSQFVYLRPDLGTHIYQFTALDELCRDLGVEMQRTNVTNSQEPPELNGAAIIHTRKAFAWDFEVTSMAEAA